MGFLDELPSFDHLKPVPTERCMVTVAVNVPPMKRENIRPDSMPVTRMASDHSSSKA